MANKMIPFHFSLKAVLLGWLMLISPILVQAQDIQRIAAIVNDEIISGYDLNQRIALTIMLSGFPNTEETKQQLTKPTLTRLVDDRLKVQEAEKYNLSVSDEEINQALTIFEERNNIEPGVLDRQLAERDIDLQTMIEQVRANLAWNKVVQRRIMSRIIISDEEVLAVQQKLEENKGKNEYLISEIYLPIEDASTEDQVREAMENLVTQLRSGAPFPQAAVQFSQGATASSGGTIGWVLADDLDPELEEVVLSLREKEISDPVKTSDGYYILTLVKIRTVLEQNPDDTLLDLTQLTIPKNPKNTPESGQESEKLANAISQFIDGCDYLPELITELAGSGSSTIGKIRVGDLPDKYKDTLSKLEVGKATPPTLDEDVYRIFVVCERNDPQQQSGSPEQVRRDILLKRTENRVRGYLQDIHNAATIEIR
jgi:peptidyl-prolyl cis-trans isomerase SurA